MDRPTARRRRHASSVNSVTVAELQAKSTPEQAGMSAIEARNPVPAADRWEPDGPPTSPGTELVLYRPPGELVPTTEPSRTDDGSDEPRLSNRLARTIMATMAAILVCGVVTAAGALSAGKPARLSPATPVMQPAALSGPAVIRPDGIIELLSSNTVQNAALTSAGGTATANGAGLTLDDDQAKQVVRTFYELLPLRRATAYALLGPDLQAEGWARFDAGWRGTREADVTRFLPDDERGGVLASVSVEQLDGNLLQLVQRFEVRLIRVDGSTQARIVNVELLSAARG